jgi:hypothetical protein
MTALNSTRRRAAGADIPVRSFGRRRICRATGCQVVLSSYNPARTCFQHDGWDLAQRTRPRRR